MKQSRRDVMMGATAMLLSAPLAHAALSPRPVVRSRMWGQTPGGAQAMLYTVEAGGIRAEFSDYGGRIVGFYLPDGQGGFDNVLVAPSDPARLTGLWAVAGAMMGRYANRIGGGRFAIDGQVYDLDRNQRGNTLHGGGSAFHTRMWRAGALADGMEMRLTSPDGEAGFPGRLEVVLRYRLAVRAGRARLTATLQATTTRPTHVNFTNHAIFNLNGAGKDLSGMDLRIAAARFTPVGEDGLPLGSFLPTAGQGFDPARFRPVAELIAHGGLDVSLALDNRGAMAPVAWLTSMRSGRRMTVYSAEPGLQLFIPAHLPQRDGEDGGYGLCLEPQHFPDTPNHGEFAATLLRPGQTRRWESIYEFAY